MLKEYELRMRSVKRGVIRALGNTPMFTRVVVSGNIADAMEKNVCHRDADSPWNIGEDTTWELVPLTVDHDLPNDTVIYTWEWNDV